MTTTRAELIGFVEDLYVPRIASGGLKSLIQAAQEFIETSILLFASGQGSQQPDLLAWLDKQKLLSDDGLEEPSGESVLIDNYSARKGEIDTKKKEMDRQGRNVKDAAFKTFDLTNATYKSIKERVGVLDGNLRSIRERTDKEGAYLPLTAEEEGRAMRYVMHAIDDVHDAVADAYGQIQTHANGIDASRPSYQSRTSHQPRTLSTPWSRGGSSVPASTATYATGDGTVDDILKMARNELGVRENGTNHVDRPYNIDDAWCASFATWVWKKAGYKVNWTNKNLVSAIWSDAKKLGLQRSTSNAQPGDMVIFDWNNDGNPDHVGIVESVNGNTITTIEGNSSDQVKRNHYNMGNSDLVGVVQTPSKKAVSV